MKINRLALIAVALMVPLSGVVSSAYAQPEPVERKITPFMFPVVQIVSLDTTARTVNVLAAKVNEKGRLLINGDFEIITIPLSPQVVLKQMHNEAHCGCSFSVGLKEIAVALQEKRHVDVSIGKNNKGEIEVKQLTGFAGPQKPLTRLFKDHFDIRPDPQK